MFLHHKCTEHIQQKLVLRRFQTVLLHSATLQLSQFISEGKWPASALSLWQEAVQPWALLVLCGKMHTPL